MSKLNALQDVDIFTGIIILFLTLSFLLVFGLLTGNVTTMKLFSKLGVRVVSGKALKDYRVTKALNRDTIGWIHITDTVYSPIMNTCNNKYEKTDYLNRENESGELYLSEGKNTLNLTSISKKQTNTDNVIKDLAIINGSATVRNDSIRKCRFTYLKKYLNTDIKNNFPDIKVIDDGKERTFQLLMGVELGLEDRKKFMLRDRETFIKTMLDNSFVSKPADTTQDIIILKATTGIDTLLVFLVEKV